MIKKCFAMTNFFKKEIKTDDPELLEILEALCSEERMHESKEIELSNSLEVDKCLETGGFITSKEIAEEILRSKELLETEDDKATTEKEIVLLVEGQ